ncbi:MAG: Uma2 family endonuclease [Chloroflexota bacterium]
MATPTLTPERTGRLRPTVQVGPPPFNPGDHLSRAEFERLYEAHPEIKKAELIEGVVYMPSPAHAETHGRPHNTVNTWLGVYAAATPGTYAYDNATVRLDMENEVQPDVLLRLGARYGGRSRVTSDDYLAGAPELVIEVAASSWAYDLHSKRHVYARNGVQEYLVVQPLEQRVDWFALREGVYETLTPDAHGVLRSEVFPGLWLQPAALWSGDLAGMLATLQEGVASAEHAAFVNRLATAGVE